MPLEKPIVFPLHPIAHTDTGAAICGCARGSACSRVGKHPAVPWRDLRLGSPVDLPANGAGYGIKTGARPKGSGTVVIDIDSEEALEHLMSMGELPETYTVQTGRGLQLHYEHPGFYVGNSKSRLGPKLDVRGDGGFVVGAGSPHASGVNYVLLDDRDPAPLPPWLLAWFQKQPKQAEVQPGPDDVTDEKERHRRREIYAKYLEEAPPCVAGQGGDGQLFAVVQYGAYDLALPATDVLELVSDIYDPRCDPPWGAELEERVLHKAHDAKTKSTRPRVPELTGEEADDWASVLEPTSLVPESAGNDGNGKESNASDSNFGFKLKWGGWADPPVSPKYLVDHLLVEGKVSMLFAEPGSIKSWTAIDLAACVAEGIPWLGERQTCKKTVLYIDFEDGEHEFHRRVWLLTGREERPYLVYTYAPGSIAEKDWWIRLEKLVKAHDIQFIVIDTLAGATPGVDENDRNAADPLIYAGWFTETSKATVLFLHHANRAGDIRGTSAFKANVDTLFKLETLEDENGVHRAKLSCVKSGHKKVYPIHLELTDEGLRGYEPEPEQKDEGDKEEKRTLDELQAEVLLLIEQEGPFSSVEKIRVRVKARKANVNAVMAELTANGDLYKSPEGWRRDSPDLRRERLRRTVKANPDWGRGKLTALSFVSKEFFEHCRQEGRIRPAIAGDEGGFIWID